MIKNNGHISIGTAALITGFTLFVPTASYSEFHVFGKLIIHNDSAQTAQNLLKNPSLFLYGIFAGFFTYIIDILLAWTIFIFLKPVNAPLSLSASWLRIVYAVLSMVALFNFLNAFQLVNFPAVPEPNINDELMKWVNARRHAINFAYIIFGTYLILVGILIYNSAYIPKILGVLMMLAGVARTIISLQPYFFKSHDLSGMMIFSIGELFFVVWLLVKGSRIKENELSTSGNTKIKN